MSCNYMCNLYCLPQTVYTSNVFVFSHLAGNFNMFALCTDTNSALKCIYIEYSVIIDVELL